MSIPTPHIAAKCREDFAPVVLMPGDPLRARFIATRYLEKAQLISEIRSVCAFTGWYKGTRISVMASGMGMPSMGIYSYELFRFYEVETIIRVGSCGAYAPHLQLKDLILAERAYSDATYAQVQSGCMDKYLRSDAGINACIQQTARRLHIPLHAGCVHSSDVFYVNDLQAHKKKYAEKGCIAEEMEAFSLLANAQICARKATTLLTVSDKLDTGEGLSSADREQGLHTMIALALESCLEL